MTVLEAVGRWIEARLGAAGQEPALDALLGELVEIWPPVTLLEELITDPALLIDVARRSYRHQNGFARIELVAGDASEFGLRLHVWSALVPEFRERVHGHPWSFASRVLAGTLHFEVFTESDGGDAVPTFHYARPDGTDRYLLAPAGTTKLRRLLYGVMPEGHCYAAHHELIHRVWARPGQGAVTLMLHGSGVAYPSRVFGTDLEGPTEHGRPRLNPQELADQLTSVRTRLQRAGGLSQ